MIDTYSISREGFGHKVLRCQDFSMDYSDEKSAIISVSDGHSDPKCFRSALGAKFACEAIIEVLRQIVSKYDNLNTIKTVSDNFMCYKGLLLKKWKQKCLDDFVANKVKNDELQEAIFRYYKAKTIEIFDINTVELKNFQQVSMFFKSMDPLKDIWNKTIKDFQQMRTQNDVRIYGTTCQAAILTDSYLMVFQNGMKGMGAINYFDKDRTEWFFKQHTDDEIRSGFTHSLCHPDTVEHMQFKVIPIDKSKPFAISICCDGLSEVFEDDKYFFAEIKNLICQLKKSGLEREGYFSERLDKISEISVDEDDVSVAFIVNKLDDFCKMISN